MLVCLPPFNNKIDEGATHYRIQELARQSGVPVLAIDHPSMGASDELTDEQRESLTGKDGYGKIAEAELRVMEELGITEIDLVGQSMGAFAAAELAKKATEFGIKVKNLVLIETPGVKEFSMTGIGMKLAAEGKYLDIYTDHPEDPQQTEAAGGALNLRQQIKIGTDGLKPDARRYGKAMAKRTSYDTIKDTLGLNDELKVTVVNGTLSGVSPAKENREMVAQLGEDGYGDRIRHMVFQGEPHTVMESAKRFGALTSLVVSPTKAV